MSAESPTRPGSLPAIPPVDVAAAMVPWRSGATAPTVPAAPAGRPPPRPPRAPRRLAGAQGTPAVTENAPTGRNRRAHAGPQLVAAIGGIGAGAAVDDQRRHTGSTGRLSSPHRAQRVTIRRRWPRPILSP